MDSPSEDHVAPPLIAGDADLIERTVNTIRTLAMDAVEAAKSGHPGTPMALAPLAYALFTRVLTYDASRPHWPDRDRFVLSCGHASMLLYALLHLTRGVPSLEEIRRFRQWGSPTAGHPELGDLPGIETTTGPLGQGFGNAVGMAIAERVLAARFNRPGHTVVGHRVWVLASDGDLMEGVSQEAASLAGHLGLSRLCVFYDDNRITIDGSTDLAFTEDVGRRFEGYGWRVQHLSDEATVEDYAQAAERARAETERPSLVICRTHIGKGSPHKQDTAAAHGSPLGEEEVRLTKIALGWPPDATFLVPDDVREHMREAGRRGGVVAQDWERRKAAWADAFPDLAAELDRRLRGTLPDGWADALPRFEPGSRKATRQTSGVVLNAIKGVVPELFGGSADLTGSNDTALQGEASLAPGHYDGRYLHYGVREHGMGAILNGIAVHGGLRPYGGTFFVFSDYMRPSIRLAALMRQKVVYVFTHDSIGLGEDGPTHQPVEHLASLRAIPGLHVIRPADGAETAEAWRQALELEGPVALVLTRQKLTELDRGPGRLADARGLARGAYVLSEAGPDPDAVLLATGSEVHVALDAARGLASDGVRARVVSMPCWSLFESLPEEDRRAVLGPEETLRVVVEAGVRQGWERWVGANGAYVTLQRFGASAPAQRLQAEFGFTADHVAGVVREALARTRS